MATVHEPSEPLEEGLESSEKTRLLLPSPNSTELPSFADLPVTLSRQSLRLAGYGTEDSPLMEVQLASMPPTKSMENVLLTSSYGEKARRRSTRPWFSRLGWSSLAVLVLLALLLVHVSFTRRHPTEPDRHHQHSTSSVVVPFSMLDPVQDLGLFYYVRNLETSPPPIFRQTLTTYPTNAWYQNMLLARGEPTNTHRAYAVPYLLDAVGPIPGLRVHPNQIFATQTLVQLTFVEQHALILGADRELMSSVSHELTKSYSVLNTKSLAVTFEWNAFPMKSSIVRGMPYATMTYETLRTVDEFGQVLLPTLGSDSAMRTSPIIDGHRSAMNCSLSTSGKVLVEHDMELSFVESDFTWLVFFSQPVWVQCGKGSTSSMVLQVTDIDTGDDSDNISPLIVRVALLNFCTTGLNPIFCREREDISEVNKFRKILKAHANYYPGENADIEFDVQDEEDTATLTFNWDARDMRSSPSQSETSRALENESNLIMYALPHHMDKFNYSLVPTEEQHCVRSLTGSACIIQGMNWTIDEGLSITSFRAPRPPTPESLFGLAQALGDDISYELPDYYQRGVGDTYFSGKMLAKLGRILIVAEELKSLCSSPSREYKAACTNVTLPSQKAIDSALNMLRSGTEVWINGKAETPFVYDSGWGGVCSCGCLFDHGSCQNKFPDCPAFFDPGLNFGNGFYNDMHYHYGYMIYAASMVAHFDPAWGRTHFEQVLLLVRNIANPSDADVHFPKFRHKDWFQGSSWASGVAIPPNLNGKNQESSSEAIAAYEAVALFGTAMMSAWKDVKADDKVAVAKEVRKVGRLLAATEVRSARRYWHVRREESARVYPSEYAPRVVGMMWSTSVQFQTWFGLKGFLAYGIQLLPLTPISEDRDGLDWVKEMYEPFADSCHEDMMCTDSGWSVLQLAMLATAGHPDLAASKTLELDADVFIGPGGNGHSRTNTLWYIATRPNVTIPIPVPKSDTDPAIKSDNGATGGVSDVVDCGVPTTCDAEALNTVASGSTCRERIVWLMHIMQKSQQDACAQVGGVEYPKECGGCNPNPVKDPKAIEAAKEAAKRCPPCSHEVCDSKLNRCPYFLNTFVCTDGPSTGGCLGTPWELNVADCRACCEMTACQKRSPPEGAVVHSGPSPECPRCSQEVCQSRLNMCPVSTAPYLCYQGASSGGCSPEPWKLSTADCDGCCEVTLDCHH